ncbi:MAG: MFS transporter [Erysipelotrichaceae bacterium]
MKNTIRLYLFIMFVDLLSITMGNIFVNVFLMRISNDFASVLLFNAISFALLSVSPLVLGSISKKVSKKIGIVLGNIISIVMYLLVILLQEKVNDFVLILSLLSGVSQGFYWLSMNTLLLELADDGHRKRLNSLQGSINSLCQLSGPLLASMIVASFPLMLGYQVLFSVIIIMMAISVIACFFLKTKPSIQPYSLKHVIKLKEFPHYLRACGLTAQIFFRDGAIPSLLNVLIFEVVKNEQVLSYYLSYMTLLAMFVYYFLSYLHVSRRKLYAIGTLLCVSSMGLLAIGLHSEIQIAIFVTLFGIGSPICMYQMNILAQNVAYKMDGNCEYSLEFTIIKELATGLGRITACVMLYLLYVKTYDFSLFWIFASLSIGISVVSIHTYRKTLEEGFHV